MPDDPNYFELGNDRWLRFNPDGYVSIGGPVNMIGLQPPQQQKLVEILQSRCSQSSEGTGQFWVHKGHSSGGEIFGPFDTPGLAGDAIGRIAVEAFKLEGSGAVGERSFTILKAKTKQSAWRIVNRHF